MVCRKTRKKLKCVKNIFGPDLSVSTVSSCSCPPNASTLSTLSCTDTGTAHGPHGLQSMCCNRAEGLLGVCCFLSGNVDPSWPLGVLLHVIQIGWHDEVFGVVQASFVGVLLPAGVIALVGDVAFTSTGLELPEVQPGLVVLQTTKSMNLCGCGLSYPFTKKEDTTANVDGQVCLNTEPKQCFKSGAASFEGRRPTASQRNKAVPFPILLQIELRNVAVFPQWLEDPMGGSFLAKAIPRLCAYRCHLKPCRLHPSQDAAVKLRQFTSALSQSDTL